MCCVKLLPNFLLHIWDNIKNWSQLHISRRENDSQSLLIFFHNFNRRIHRLVKNMTISTFIVWTYLWSILPWLWMILQLSSMSFLQLQVQRSVTLLTLVFYTWNLMVLVLLVFYWYHSGKKEMLLKSNLNQVNWTNLFILGHKFTVIHTILGV